MDDEFLEQLGELALWLLQWFAVLLVVGIFLEAIW